MFRALSQSPIFRAPRRGFVADTVTWLAKMNARHRDAHDLRYMTDAMLDDIGLTRGEADAEARRLEQTFR